MNARTGLQNVMATAGTTQELGIVSIVIPVYNEEAAIGYDLQTIFTTMDQSGYQYEVLVVDDGSKDTTASKVAQYPRARLVQHPVNLGVGAARTTGMGLALGEIVVTTDGDGTYPNQEIPRLLAGLETSDMVVGARVREAGTWPWLRSLAKASILWLASYLTGRSIPDLNSGMRCFRKPVAEQFVPFLPKGHSWESTITLAYLTAGYRVAFLPIEYYPRRGGRSSFHPLRDTLSYLRLVMRTILYFDPLKFLAPLSLGLLLVGGLSLAWKLLVDAAVIMAVAIVPLVAGALVGVAGLYADRRLRRSPRFGRAASMRHPSVTR